MSPLEAAAAKDAEGAAEGGSRMQDTKGAQPDRDWREEAVCRETDPELFFPTATHGRVYEEQVAAAKAVCARCPVRAQCLQDALVGIPVGIAGGLTEGERRALRRRSGSGDGRTRRVDERREQVRELLGRGRSAPWLASRVGVSVRTVERWLAEDRASAASLEGDRERAAVS